MNYRGVKKTWLAVGLVLLGMAGAGGVERIVIGEAPTRWTQVEDVSAFLAVNDDSIWTWAVEPDQNLGLGVVERGGRVLVATEAEGFMAVPAAAFVVDGDGNTAFNPRQQDVPPEAELYVDLGATFGIRRVRLFPRLDEEHRALFPRFFELGVNQGDVVPRLKAPLSSLRYQTLMRFSSFSPNQESVVDWPGIRQFGGGVKARYLHFTPLLGVPWELAELEVYADGTAPVGEFLSLPLLARSGYPVWGRVLYDGGDITELSVVVQTHTGPDDEPLHYFIRTGERERQVNRAVWENIEGIQGAAVKGPVLPNPEWSAWETVTDGVVRSPSPNRYLQFRLRLSEPGVSIKRLIFEYATPPLAEDLAAEIWPTVVDAGAETGFALSMIARKVERPDRVDTGFRYIRVKTPAEIVAVDRVEVDDQEAVFTAEYGPGGFTVNLWHRIVQDGTFVKLFFRGRVFVDGTTFEVQALDRRSTADAQEEVYQVAREGDVEPLWLGASLVVRLRETGRELVGGLRPRTLAFTPNGDGVNDFFEIGYYLLKLTRAAPVFFEIYDLAGRRVAQGFSEDANGRFARIWDGSDGEGKRVRPGLYLYRVQVHSDERTASRQGVVSVVY